MTTNVVVVVVVVLVVVVVVVVVVHVRLINAKSIITLSLQLPVSYLHCALYTVSQKETFTQPFVTSLFFHGCILPPHLKYAAALPCEIWKVSFLFMFQH